MLCRLGRYNADQHLFISCPLLFSPLSVYYPSISLFRIHQTMCLFTFNLSTCGLFIISHHLVIHHLQLFIYFSAIHPSIQDPSVHHPPFHPNSLLMDLSVHQLHTRQSTQIFFHSSSVLIYHLSIIHGFIHQLVPLSIHAVHINRLSVIRPPASAIHLSNYPPIRCHAIQPLWHPSINCVPSIYSCISSFNWNLRVYFSAIHPSTYKSTYNSSIHASVINTFRFNSNPTELTLMYKPLLLFLCAEYLSTTLYTH